MPVKIIRGLFFLACMIMGVIWGQYIYNLSEPRANAFAPELLTNTWP
jgi:hypothetical protein